MGIIGGIVLNNVVLHGIIKTQRNGGRHMFGLFRLVRGVLGASAAALGVGKAAFRAKKMKRWLRAMPLSTREDVIIMKKSTLIAWVAFFSAVAGALAAAYFYIQRREAELDECEQLLFSEDFCDETPEDACCCGEGCACDASGEEA